MPSSYSLLCHNSAVDVVTRQVVFLKDTWCDNPVNEVEGETLGRLQDLGVRFTPSLVWHGDVPNRLLNESCHLTRRS